MSSSLTSSVKSSLRGKLRRLLTLGKPFKSTREIYEKKWKSLGNNFAERQASLAKLQLEHITGYQKKVDEILSIAKDLPTYEAQRFCELHLVKTTESQKIELAFCDIALKAKSEEELKKAVKMETAFKELEETLKEAGVN